MAKQVHRAIRASALALGLPFDEIAEKTRVAPVDADVHHVDRGLRVLRVGGDELVEADVEERAPR